MKVRAHLARAKEAAREKEEGLRMLAEERRTWDSYELKYRNHMWLIKQVRRVLRSSLGRIHTLGGNPTSSST